MPENENLQSTLKKKKTICLSFGPIEHFWFEKEICKLLRWMLDLFGMNSRHIWPTHTNIKPQSILTCLLICLPRPSLTLVICVCAENKHYFRRMLLKQLKMLVLSTHTPTSPSSNFKQLTAALYISSTKLEQISHHCSSFPWNKTSCERSCEVQQKIRQSKLKEVGFQVGVVSVKRESAFVKCFSFSKKNHHLEL